MTFVARAVSCGVAALFAGFAGVAAVGCDSVFRFDPSADGGGVDEAAVGDGAAGPRPCTADTACGGLRCQVSTGVCVACLGDADCSGVLGRCDTLRGSCVECNATAECPQRRGCDTVTKRCLDLCLDGDDACPVSGFVCDGDRNLCIECTTSANCVGSPNGAVCDVPIGRCVECTGNAKCPSSKPVCDRRSGRCAACVTSAECSVGSVCDRNTLTCR